MRGGRIRTGGTGLCLAARHATWTLRLQRAFLAFRARLLPLRQLRTETVRAPVLASELRYIPVTGYVEEFEPRATGRARLTLRVLLLGDLAPAERPYRVRVSFTAKEERPHTGDAVALRATVSPPPDPIEPGGFDFGRQVGSHGRRDGLCHEPNCAPG
ncbi:MAG: DUF4131 domain-containing protein [Hyphomicrobiales bacterium]